MSHFDKRHDYNGGILLESMVSRDPMEQFHKWFEDASNHSEIVEANAMTLATATPTGMPSARMVLLRKVDTGFVFFTNYESRKGNELEQNPYAALVFYWAPMERQVRVEGIVSRVSAEESDAYFNSRPYKSRLGALISKQSSVVEDSELLRVELSALQAQYPEKSGVPRPSNWGGYRVTPTSIEFWQGRESRLHDRLRFRREPPEHNWTLERLAP